MISDLINNLFDFRNDEERQHPSIIRRLNNIFLNKIVRVKSDGREFKCFEIRYTKTYELTYYRQHMFEYKCACIDKDNDVSVFYPDALEII